MQAQYTLGQPANDPATRSYWSHDTSDATSHTVDTDNEFAGRLDRHSQCTDCHDPHGTTTDPATMTATGWTLPGGLANVSGVAVSNGAAGTAPTYTWLDGTVAPVTAEYQLCFKCHSGFTTLPGDVPGKPSQDVSDLGVALNPANASYHPIEAPGRNQTQKLADSLAGTSPYKLWNFTTGDTVRCVSCHSSNTTGTASDPAQNAPGATLTVHASTNRGILVRPYENRVLTAAGRFYDNQGFALCLTCHMETPFMNQYRPAAAEGTNFVFHGLHMAGITDQGQRRARHRHRRGPARATRAARSATSTTTARPTCRAPRRCPATGSSSSPPTSWGASRWAGCPRSRRPRPAVRAPSPATARTTRAPRTATEPGTSIGYVPVGG